jgi:DNA modification methylase
LLINGNALHIPLADNSVQLCVTSPPYYKQRSYLTSIWSGGDELCTHDAARHKNRFDYPVNEKQLSNTGSAYSEYDPICPDCGAIKIDHQLGQERTHDCFGWVTGNPCGGCFTCHLVDAFREVKRVLRPDGILFLNLGDTYNGSGGAGGDYQVDGFREGQDKYIGAHDNDFKDKDLLCVPHSVAMALRQDGWFLRATIPWIKKNAYVDGGARDRPATKVEFIFMLTKSANYYYDRHATLVPYTSALNRWGGAIVKETSESGWAKTTGDKLNRHRHMRPNSRGRLVRPSDWFYDSLREVLNGENGLLLDEDMMPMALSVKTEASGVPHYATFPKALVLPFVLSGTSEAGCCAICRKPLERRVSDEGHELSGEDVADRWEKTCSCETQKTTPCLVFDAFAGVSTTGIVANELGRRYIGMDLSMEYLSTGRQRTSKAVLPLFEEV